VVSSGGEITFYQLKTKKKTFFYRKPIRKTTNFKIQGDKAPVPPLPTPVELPWRCQVFYKLAHVSLLVTKQCYRYVKEVGFSVF